MTQSPLPGLVREDYPSNSNLSKQKASEPQARPKREPVAKGHVTEKKKNILEKFLGDDLRDIASYILMDVVVPGVKSAILDSIEMAFFGEVRGKRPGKGGGSPPWYTYVDYTGAPRSARPQARTSNRSARKEIRSATSVTFDTKWEAEQVVENMSDIISEAGQVSAGDFFEAAGLPTTSSDYSYGWTDISTVRVIKTRAGWAIKLPREEQL